MSCDQMSCDQMSCDPDDQSGNSSVGRASAFQAEGRGFESRFPLHPVSSMRSASDATKDFIAGWRYAGVMKSGAHVAQPVEHLHGKQAVSSSSLLVGSISNSLCSRVEAATRGRRVRHSGANPGSCRWRDSDPARGALLCVAVHPHRSLMEALFPWLARSSNVPRST